MLGKLIKHDMRCCSKAFIPMLVAYLSVCLLMVVAIRYADNIDNMTSMMGIMVAVTTTAFVGLLYALLFYSFFGSVSRFKKNLFTDEGYLMNTLPVKPWQHITSKLLSSFIWYAITLAAIFLSMAILAVGISGLDEIGRMVSGIIRMMKELLKEGVGVVMLGLVMLLTSGVCVLLLLYFVTALENVFKLRKGVFGLLSFIAGVVLFWLISTEGARFVINVVEAFDPKTTQGTLELVFGCVSIFSALFSVVFFIGTNYIISHKLNLE